jgi:hypothetical protein
MNAVQYFKFFSKGLKRSTFFSIITIYPMEIGQGRNYNWLLAVVVDVRPNTTHCNIMIGCCFYGDRC